MSIVHYIKIGYFEVNPFPYPQFEVEKSIQEDEISALECAIEECFAIKYNLKSYLNKDGLIQIEYLGRVDRWETVYQIACMAHYMFGMSASDLGYFYFPPQKEKLSEFEQEVNIRCQEYLKKQELFRHHN